ncbi:DUF998 domain-containing protein [Ekhidna sp.]|uniref:DUF998 domain-containing protein n=1 Tax=Ekhidna sp. TaxID=2608089 RepID=UPI0032991427
MKKTAGLIGLLSVSLFVISLIVFGSLHPKWNFLNNFISQLGAKGEPLALWWNLIGFVNVGLLLLLFGLYYGKVLKDKLAGILLSLFGLGFALTAIPTDELDSKSAVSKAHVVAICFALAFWLFGLARISSNGSNSAQIRYRANIAAVLLVSSMIGFAIGLWSMPLTHRLVFAVVFGWTAWTSFGLLRHSFQK